MDVGIYFLGILIGSVIWGIITKAISNSRGCEGGFWWGFWLWVIGVIIVAVRPAQNTQVVVAQPAVNAYDELEKVVNLHNCGAITDSEFAKLKADLMKKM